MSQPTNPLPAGSAPEPPVPYRRVYAWVFQAWLVMFLGVSYIPK